MLRYLLLCLLCLSALSANPSLILPPPHVGPIPIQCKSELLNFISIDDKNETFLSDVYFTFLWNDPRLVNSSEELQIFLDDSAADKLKEIWWPELEFLNAGLPTYNNRTLLIAPDGEVTYHISITANFRTHLDLTHFPFDQQKLEILVDSFIWNRDVIQFIPEAGNGVNLTATLHNDERILKIEYSVIDTHGLRVAQFGNSDQFSTFVTTIYTERRSGFFFYQLFVPLFLILIISCTVFLAYRSDYMQTIGISLASFLVFLAAKFTLNQDLPKVGYMTVIDKAFLLGYIAIGLEVLLVSIREIWGSMTDRRNLVDRICVHAIWVVLLLFTAAMVWIFLAG